METKRIRFLVDQGFAKAGSAGVYSAIEADHWIDLGVAEETKDETVARGAPDDDTTGRRGRRFRKTGDDE